MAVALRPLTLAELLDRTFQLYRNHFGLFVGIAAVPYVVVLILQVLARVALGGVSGTPGALFADAALLLVLAIATIAALAFSIGGTVFGVSAAHLGEPITVGQALGRMKKRIGAVLGATAAIGILAFLPLVVVTLLIFLVPGLGISRAQLALMTSLLMIAAALCTLWVMLRYAVTIPALLLEKLRIRAALRRSARLSKGALGRVFVVIVMVVILELVLAIVLGLIAAMVGFHGLGTPAMTLPRAGAPILGIWYNSKPFINFALQVLVAPIFTIALVLMFFDFKVRKEAFDIELLLRRNEATGASA